MGASLEEKKPSHWKGFLFLAAFLSVLGILAATYWIMEGKKDTSKPVEHSAGRDVFAVPDTITPKVTTPQDTTPTNTLIPPPRGGEGSIISHNVDPAHEKAASDTGTSFTDLHLEPSLPEESAKVKPAATAHPPHLPTPGTIELFPGKTDLPIKTDSFLPDPFATISQEQTFPDNEDKGSSTDLTDPTLRSTTRMQPEKTDPGKDTVAPKEVPTTPPPVLANAAEEILYEESLPAPEPQEKTPERETPPVLPPKKSSGNQIALVIDDLGYNKPISKAIVQLNADLTLAVLPGGGFSKEVAAMAQASGKELILHQPMQPQGYPGVKPGPGAIFSSMSEDQIHTILTENFKLFPYARGLNNHMGSYLTNDVKAMDAVMKFLKPRGFFFLDSRTSTHSVAENRAIAMGIPTTRRDVFIDNVQEKHAVLKKLEELVSVAKSHGRAIGIGHPHQETLDALREWLPTLRSKGIEVARLSHFLPQSPGAKEPKPAATAASPAVTTAHPATTPSPAVTAAHPATTPSPAVTVAHPATTPSPAATVAHPATTPSPAATVAHPATTPSPAATVASPDDETTGRAPKVTIVSE